MLLLPRSPPGPFCRPRSSLCPINDHCNFPYFVFFTESNRNGALISMPKPALKIVSPDTQIRKVKTPRRPRNADVRTREYLTESEVERLIKGCGGNRWPHRDATMILLAFRHGLRASELTRDGIPDRCKPTWVTRTSSTQFATPSWHQPVSRAGGRTEQVSPKFS